MKKSSGPFVLLSRGAVAATDVLRAISMIACETGCATCLHKMRILVKPLLGHRIGTRKRRVSVFFSDPSCALSDSIKSSSFLLRSRVERPIPKGAGFGIAKGS